ncbi:MAG: hypothetical protein J0H62_11990, partial [Rhizobiales bacterium]|nr:hypothetical protein [Hyphomicrobiales bacterium]
MNKYGNIHAMSDFVQATFPRARSGEPPSFAKMVLIGLMRLDAVQQKNQLVTLSVSTGGGIWVTYAGIRYLVIIPAQRWLRIVSDDVDDRVSRALDKAARRSAEAVEDTTGSNSYRQWNVYAGGLDDLWNLVESLPAPSRSEILRKAREHRNFPGSIRQAALEMFRLDGSICPGV